METRHTVKIALAIALGTFACPIVQAEEGGLKRNIRGQVGADHTGCDENAKSEGSKKTKPELDGQPVRARIQISLDGGDDVEQKLFDPQTTKLNLDKLVWKKPADKLIPGAPEWQVQVFEGEKKLETIRVYFRGLFVRESDGMIAFDKTGFWVLIEKEIAKDPKWRAILGER